MQELTDNPGKKTVASVGLPLRNGIVVNLRKWWRVKNQLDEVDKLSRTETKANWDKYEELRRSTRDLNKRSEGFFQYWSVAAAAVMVAVALSWIASRTKDADFYKYPENSLRIVENLDPCLDDGSCGQSFMVQNVRAGVAYPPAETHFCYPQHFEAGMTFEWIRVKQLGSCMVVDGYNLLYQDHKTFEGGKLQYMPVIPANCRFDWTTPKGHVLCEGGKAKF